MPDYTSDIVLGAKYRDGQTGMEGTAVVLLFHQHSCERVVLESPTVEGDDLRFFEFDAVRLENLEPLKEKPEAVSTGATVTSGVRRSGRRQR